MASVKSVIMESSVNKKFARSANYTNEDKARLISIVTKYVHVIECKLTDGTTKSEKNRAWEMIAEDFNSQSASVFRTAASLRNCYDNEKKRARRAVGDEKVEIFKTVGNLTKANQVLLVSPLQEKVLGLIPGTAEPLDNPYDNDSSYVDLIAAARREQSSSEDEGSPGRTLSTTNSPIPPNMVDVTANFEFVAPTNVNQSQPMTSNPVDWSKYTPKMLRTPKYKTTISKSILPVPTKAKCTPPTSSIPANKSLQEAGTSRASPNTSWTSRRRPSLQNPPVSAVSIKFENLAEAKLSLVQLQIAEATAESARKVKRESEEVEMRKAREREEFDRRADEYTRKHAREESEEERKKAEHEIKLKILQAELDIKLAMLKNIPNP